MITTDETGRAMVSLPPMEETFRTAQGTDDPGLYDAGAPRIDWRRARKAAVLGFLTLCAAASLLVSLANRWWP
nr:hypothetical protein [Mesorhizobium sp.]